MFLDLYGKYRISVISFSTNLVYLLSRLLPNIVLETCCCVRLFQRSPGSPSSPSSKIFIKDEADQLWPASYKNPSSSLSRSTNLHRAGSIQNLISKFSGPDQVFSSGYSHIPKPGRLTKAYSVEVLDSPTSPLTPCSPDQVPNITITPPAKGTSQSESQDNSKTSQIAARIDCPEGGDTEKADLKERKSKTLIFDFGIDSVGDSGLGSVSKKEKPLTYCLDVTAWDKTLHHQHGTAGFWKAWWGTVIGVHETRFQWQDSPERLLQSSRSDFRLIGSNLFSVDCFVSNHPCDAAPKWFSSQWSPNSLFFTSPIEFFSHSFENAAFDSRMICRQSTSNKLIILIISSQPKWWCDFMRHIFYSTFIYSVISFPKYILISTYFFSSLIMYFVPEGKKWITVSEDALFISFPYLSSFASLVIFNHSHCQQIYFPVLPRHYFMSTFVTSALLQESEMDSNKQPDSPTEEEPSTPRAVPTSQNPKYQLFLSKDLKTNGVSGKDADGPGGGGSVGENGPRLSRWETNRLGVNRGSSESLASRDLDAVSDRVGDVEHGFCLCVV